MKTQLTVPDNPGKLYTLPGGELVFDQETYMSVKLSNNTVCVDVNPDCVNLQLIEAICAEVCRSIPHLGESGKQVIHVRTMDPRNATRNFVVSRPTDTHDTIS